MINFRKPLIHALLRVSTPTIAHALNQLQQLECLNQQEIKYAAEQKLTQLLTHAAKNVPYYAQILNDCGVVRPNKIDLDNFHKIPPLTKHVIRKQANNLLSADYKTRSPYENTSGGSTGEPVRFVQDKQYHHWNIAHKLYFNLINNVQPGEKQIKLWGSERDIFGQKEKLSTSLSQQLFNITTLNSFRMSDQLMAEYADIWNRLKPSLIWSYTSSITEFARFLEKYNRKVTTPKAIITTAETLSADTRAYLQKVFNCHISDQYGSREVGPVACECAHGNLHVFSLNNKLEILNDDITPTPPGQVGHIYITNLHNYSMPLIRYRIGDTAVPKQIISCPCGRNWPVIEKITGRISDHFRTADGKIIHGEYFTHLFYQKPGIKQFQVLQKAHDRITVYIVPDQDVNDSDIQEIENKIKLVMAESCDVNFQFVDNIPRNASGKYRYTISEVTQ